MVGTWRLLGAFSLSATLMACGSAQKVKDDTTPTKQAAENVSESQNVQFCKYSTPRSGQWEVERGYAQGKNQATAVEAARKAAKQNLVDRLYQSYDRTLVDRVASQIDVSYYEPQYDAATGNACVFAFLNSDALQKVDQSSKKYADELTKALQPLRQQVQKQIQKGKLCIDTPSSDLGGNAGAAGPKLRTRLVSLFEGQKLSMTDCWHLGGLISSASERCDFVPTLSRNGESIPVGEISFHPLALGLKNCNAQGASSLRNVDMGLTSGSYHTGSTGLSVALSMGSADSSMALCAGDVFELEVETNAPALVRFYSVAADGRVMLDYELDVNGRAVLPQMIAVQLKPDLQYRMVAVAIPRGESFGDFEPSKTSEASGACISHHGLKVSDFPAVAAWAAVDHEVRAPGSAGCPNDRQTLDLHQQIISIVNQMPNCR